MTLWDEASRPDDRRWVEIAEDEGKGRWPIRCERRTRISCEALFVQLWEQGERRLSPTATQSPSPPKTG